MGFVSWLRVERWRWSRSEGAGGIIGKYGIARNMDWADQECGRGGETEGLT